MREVGQFRVAKSTIPLNFMLKMGEGNPIFQMSDFDEAIR